MHKHICIISTAHNAKDIRIFHKQAQSLSKAGNYVTYLVTHDQDEKINDIEIRAMPKRNKFHRLLSIPQVFRLARSIRADVYHLHDPELIILGWWLHLIGHRVIYDVHEDIGALLPDRPYVPKLMGKSIGSCVNWIEKSIANQLDTVITATDAIAEGFAGINPFVVKNYPIVEGYPVKKYSASPQPGLHAIYVGVLTEVRGILEMVEAVNNIDRSHSIRLTIVGSFPNPNYETRVVSAAGRNVTFVGRKPYYEAMTMLQEADVGLVCFFPLPNHVRALPNKMFEYMRAGLPVIASNMPLWHEIIVGGGCGLTVNPCKPSSIASALISLSRNPEQRKQMGEKGRQLVCKQYNWKTQEPILFDAYNHAFGN